MKRTPKFALPYPEPADHPKDYPAVGEELATKVENLAAKGTPPEYWELEQRLAALETALGDGGGGGTSFVLITGNLTGTNASGGWLDWRASDALPPPTGVIISDGTTKDEDRQTVPRGTVMLPPTVWTVTVQVFGAQVSPSSCVVYVEGWTGNALNVPEFGSFGILSRATTNHMTHDGTTTLTLLPVDDGMGYKQRFGAALRAKTVPDGLNPSAIPNSFYAIATFQALA